MLNEVAPEIGSFWSPVAQIAPVFALALVIEGRQVAQTWKITNRKQRLTQAAALIFSANVLWLVESNALGSMALGVSNPVILGLSAVGLCIVFLIMCLNPVTSIALSGGIELSLVLGRLAPGSAWRRRRKSTAQLSRTAAGIVEKALERAERLDRHVQILKDAKKKLREGVDDPAYAEYAVQRIQTIGLAYRFLISPMTEAHATMTYQQSMKKLDSWLRKAKKRRRKFSNTLIDISLHLNDVEELEREVDLLHFDQKTEYRMGQILLEAQSEILGSDRVSRSMVLATAAEDSFTQIDASVIASSEH